MWVEQRTTGQEEKHGASGRSSYHKRPHVQGGKSDDPSGRLPPPKKQVLAEQQVFPLRRRHLQVDRAIVPPFLVSRLWRVCLERTAENRCAFRSSLGHCIVLSGHYNPAVTMNRGEQRQDVGLDTSVVLPFTLSALICSGRCQSVGQFSVRLSGAQKCHRERSKG